MMKKQYFSTILAAACLLLPGCSNDNEPVNEGSTTVEAVVGDSDVEIRLSSSSSSSAAATRAGIEGDNFYSFEAEGLGIFCVAKGKQNPEINPPAPDIDWTRYADPTKTDVLMYNVPANAVKDTITIDYDMSTFRYTSTSIVWADSEAQYFYPISNWYMYDFYGYYPIQDDANVTVTPEEIMVYMEIDGHQDFLIGYAVSEEDYAYSAKYFRTAERQLPEMVFHHRLNRFTFTVEAGADDYSGSKANATRMSVKEITLLDMPYQFETIVATTDYADWASGWYYYGTRDFYLFEENGVSSEPVQVSEEGRTKVGDALFVLPGMESYGIRVVLVDEEGREYVSEYPLSISEHLDGGTTKGGYSYNIHMTVYGPQEIGLNAWLVPWEIVETDIPIEL